MDVEQTARTLYETLSKLGHGPRPWARHNEFRQAWATLPEGWREEYRVAARAVLGLPTTPTGGDRCQGGPAHHGICARGTPGCTISHQLELPAPDFRT